MRLFLCLILFLLLSACSPASFPQLLTPCDQQLFMQGLSEFGPEGEVPEAFVLLQQRCPDSPWTAKARALQALQETVGEQQQTINQLQGRQQTIRKQNQELQQQIDAMQGQLQGLETERTKLRQLLIDLEQRRR